MVSRCDISSAVRFPLGLFLLGIPPCPRGPACGRATLGELSLTQAVCRVRAALAIRFPHALEMRWPSVPGAVFSSSSYSLLSSPPPYLKLPFKGKFLFSFSDSNCFCCSSCLFSNMWDILHFCSLHAVFQLVAHTRTGKEDLELSFSCQAI